MARKLAVAVWIGLAVVWLAAGKRSDVDALARTGGAVAVSLKAVLPDASKVAGPFVAFKPGNVLPIEESVRVRIRTDKSMAGAEVTVLPGAVVGEVKLRGIVPTAQHRVRAIELAEATVGVERVVDEIAVPEPAVDR